MKKSGQILCFKFILFFAWSLSVGVFIVIPPRFSLATERLPPSAACKLRSGCDWKRLCPDVAANCWWDCVCTGSKTSASEATVSKQPDLGGVGGKVKPSIALPRCPAGQAWNETCCAKVLSNNTVSKECPPPLLTPVGSVGTLPPTPPLTPAPLSPGESVSCTLPCPAGAGCDPGSYCINGCCVICPGGPCTTAAECQQRFFHDLPGSYSCINGCCVRTCPFGSCASNMECDQRFFNEPPGTTTCIDGCCKKVGEPSLQPNQNQQ